MSNKLPIRLRSANEEDISFIFNSWLKSFRNSNYARNIDNAIYYHGQHKLLEHLLKTNTVIVACDQNDPAQLYGYICAGFEDGFFVLHYLYVKHNFRNMGIGKELLNSFDHDPTNTSIYTHYTRSAERLAGKFNFVYHPYLLLNTPEYKKDEDIKPTKLDE